MAQTSRAWVMNVGPAGQVAAGERHVAEYLVATDTVPVPRTRPHCAGVIYWRDHYIPVIDLGPLYDAHTSEAGRRAVVLAYQNAPGEPLQYGALLIHAAPVEAWVSDDMAAEVPTVPPALRHISRASFYMNDQVIPVLDVRLLFAQALPAHVFPKGDEAAIQPTNTLQAKPAPETPSEVEEAPTISEEIEEMAILSSGLDRLAEAEEGSDTPEPPAPESTEPAAADPIPRSPHGVVTPFVPRRPWSAADAVSQDSLTDSPEPTPEDSEELVAELPANFGVIEPQDVSSASVSSAHGQAPVSSSLQDIYTSISQATRATPRKTRKRRSRALGIVLILVLAAVLGWMAMKHVRPGLLQSLTRTMAPVFHVKKTAAVGSASVPDAPVQPPK